MKPCWVALIVAVGWLGGVRIARADPRVTVSQTGEPCPETSLAQRVDAYLAPTAGPAETGEPWRASGTLGRENTGVWRVDLDIEAPGARPTSRMFRAERCAAAIDAAAYVLSLAIDPEVAQRPAPPLPEPEVQEKPHEGEAEERELQRASGATSREDELSDGERELQREREREAEREAERERDRIRGLLRASAGFTAGAMPGINAAFGGAIGLAGERWRMELYGFYRLETAVEAERVPDAGGLITQYAVGPRGCYVPGLRRRQIRFEFPLCAGAEAGEMLGQGFGALEDTGQGRRAWGAITLSPGAGIAVLPQLAFVFTAEVAFALRRPTFFLNPSEDSPSQGLETLYRVGPVSGRGWLGIEVRFP